MHNYSTPREGSRIEPVALVGGVGAGLCPTFRELPTSRCWCERHWCENRLLCGRLYFHAAVGMALQQGSWATTWVNSTSLSSHRIPYATTSGVLGSPGYPAARAGLRLFPPTTQQLSQP